MNEFDTPSVILFGSTARQDNDVNSDIDILIINDNPYPQSIKKEKIEIQTLPRIEAEKKAARGDLFMIHVLHEGIVISDPQKYFFKLKEDLIIKKSYHLEITEALTLAAFIESNWKYFKNKDLLSKRISWSVRTVVIGKLIESGKIIFSPAGIIKSVKEMNVTNLVALRRSNLSVEELIPDLRRFILIYGGQNLLGLSAPEYADAFKAYGNSVSLSTFRSMLSDAEDFLY